MRVAYTGAAVPATMSALRDSRVSMCVVTPFLSTAQTDTSRLFPTGIRVTVSTIDGVVKLTGCSTVIVSNPVPVIWTTNFVGLVSCALPIALMPKSAAVLASVRVSIYPRITIDPYALSSGSVGFDPPQSQFASSAAAVITAAAAIRLLNPITILPIPPAPALLAQPKADERHPVTYSALVTAVTVSPILLLFGQLWPTNGRRGGGFGPINMVFYPLALRRY